jgi:hypothetical protein
VKGDGNGISIPDAGVAGAVIVATALSIIALPAKAQVKNQVTADIDTVRRIGDLGPGNLAGATTSLFAFSQQFRNPAAGPNAFISAGYGKVGGGPVTIVPPISEGKAGGVGPKIRVPPTGPFISSGPPLATARNIPKSNITNDGDMDFLSSTSGIYSATASQQQVFSGFRGIAGQSVRQIEAEAETTSSPFVAGRLARPGKAAADAQDPFAVAGGASYGYVFALDASLQLDDPGVSGAVFYYATDSNLFTTDSLDNFILDGAPLDGALWTLGLTADAPVGAASGLGIDFELNPVALQEISFRTAYLAALPGYSSSLTAAQLAPLIDAQIDAAIAQDLAPGATGGVGLGDFSPFPDGTTYTPLNGADDLFEEGVAAALEAVPEPPALPLLAAALAAIAMARRRGRAAAGGDAIGYKLSAPLCWLQRIR